MYETWYKQGSKQGIYEYALINNIITTEDGEHVSILEWIEQKINTNPYKEVTVDIVYMKKILGPDFEDKSDEAIRTSLRRAFKKFNIDLRTALIDDGNVKINMRLIPDITYDKR